jgi:hypothetical protein
MKSKLFGTFFFSIILFVVLVPFLSTTALAGDKNHTYKVTNTADFVYGCDITMRFTNYDDVKFPGVKKGESVTKESKKCLEALMGSCITWKWEGEGYPPYGTSTVYSGMHNLYDLHLCDGAEFEIRPSTTQSPDFVRIK